MKLFSDTKGSYISSATRKGEAAGCNFQLGGYFTNSFNKILYESLKKEVDTDPFIAWQQIWEDVGVEATSIAESRGKEQHMQYKYVK